MDNSEFSNPSSADTNPDDGEDDISDIVDEVRDGVLSDESTQSVEANRGKSSLPGGYIPKSSLELYTGRQDSEIYATIRPAVRDNYVVGSYVTIPLNTTDDTERRLLTSIETVKYVSHTDDSNLIPKQYQQSETSDEEFAQLVQLNPISVIAGRKRSEYEAEPVGRPPRPGQPVDITEEKEVLSTGLNIPDTGVFTGWMSVGGEKIPSSEDPLPYNIYNPTAGDKDNDESALFRHIQLSGSTGKGKTHFAKNLLRQLTTGLRYTMEVQDSGETKELDKELGIIIIDPENEYVEMRDPPQEQLSKDFLSLLDENDIAYGGVDTPNCPADFNIAVPETENAQTPVFGDETRFGIPFTAVRNRMQLLVNNRAEGPTRHEIQKCLREFFKKFESGDTYSEFKDFVQIYLDRIENESIQGAVRRRVYSSAAENVFNRGDSHNASFRSVVKNHINPGSVTVIPTGHLTGREEKTVVSAILATIIENKISSGETIENISQTPLLLVLDEAHEYLSEPSNLREEYILQKYIRAAKRGRKDKLGLLNITQSPEDIHPEISQQTNTRIYLGLEPGVVDSSNVYIPDRFTSDIVNYSKGQAVVKQPDIEAVEILGLPYCLTKHTN